jgi:hypothetical protein
LTGCAAFPFAAPTGTPTPASTRTATATQTPTATPRPTPTLKPTPTLTTVPPMPDEAQIVIGRHCNYYPGTIYHEQATVEYVDLSEYRNKLFAVETYTGRDKIRVGIYRGKVNLSKWWGDSTTYISETPFTARASIKFQVSPESSIYTIVYIARPIEDKVPQYPEITRYFSVQEPKYPTDWSQTFVTEFWTFPDSILDALVDPPQFNENMNREYAALKDLTGKDSDLLDEEGHIRLIMDNLAFCGWAGNPILMGPSCMNAKVLNSGNPGWGAARELGYAFAGPGSYSWKESGGGGGGAEGWADFMAFYAYDNNIFVNSEFDRALWSGVWETSSKPTDIFQGLIVKLSHQYGWDVAKTFFRKYLDADPARGSSTKEKQRQAVLYLAESALEAAGDQEAYDYVVNFLTQKGFPAPLR